MENLKQGLGLLHEVSGMAAVNKATHINCENAKNALGAFIEEATATAASLVVVKKALAKAEKTLEGQVDSCEKKSVKIKK